MRKDQVKAYLQIAQAKLQRLPALRNINIANRARLAAAQTKNEINLLKSRIAARLSSLDLKQVHKLVSSVIYRLKCGCVYAVSLLERIFFINKRVKYIVISSVLTLALVTSTSIYAHIESFTYVVYLDGEEIGFVAEATIIDEIMAVMRAEESQVRGVEVATQQALVITREQRKGIKEDEQAVKERLKEEIHFKQYAYTITINGRPALTVATIEEYEQVVEALKNAYVSGKDNVVIQAVVLNDKVEARLSLVEPQEIYTVDKATDILRNGTNKREVYLVSRGDSLWSIAQNNKVSITDIKSANPQLAGSERLMPGDELSLVVAEPLVNVSVTQDVPATERIPYETEYKNDSSLFKGQTKVRQAGVNGAKEVLYRITQQNGREIAREVLNETIVKEPQLKIVARGTKAIPAGTIVGTGRFLWPVVGRGRITSRYGYRGRGFHRGVDIGTPTGTGILAADNGTVIQSGWAASYGILITIDHGNGFITKYAHNSATLVFVGQKVQRGQQIARSGSTGNSTGPHLHFEVIRNGSTINPLSQL